MNFIPGKTDFVTRKFFMLTENVERLELAIWLILILLLILTILRYIEFEKNRMIKNKTWDKYVEEWYEQGKYDKVQNTLATQEALLPCSAAVKWWQGRCHFQQKKWAEAVEKFNECCLLEPFYREHVKDYMAFIELNELVKGVEGYIK